MKLLNITLLLGVLISAGFASCKEDCKQVDYTVDGVVYDLCTNQPLKNVSVQYSFKGNGDMLDNKGCGLPGANELTTTAPDGTYRVAFTTSTIIGGVKGKLSVAMNGLSCDSPSYTLLQQTNLGRFNVLHQYNLSIPVRFSIYNLTPQDTFYISGPVNKIVKGDTGVVVVLDTVRVPEVLLSEHRLKMTYTFGYSKGVNGDTARAAMIVPANCNNQYAEQAVTLNK